VLLNKENSEKRQRKHNPGRLLQKRTSHFLIALQKKTWKVCYVPVTLHVYLFVKATKKAAVRIHPIKYKQPG